MIRYKFLLLFCSFLFSWQGASAYATEYVAFSLKVAQERITSTPKGEDYRNIHPEVFTIGGITAVRGLVYDRNLNDPIIVGERDPQRAPLTLDDFVVALKARFIHGKWPLVSIDPTPETEKTQMQIVRFEGGIENTKFGEDMLEADYSLKKIMIGLLDPGVPGVLSHWDLLRENPEKGLESKKITSRFWFYPILPSVMAREDVVAIKGLKVGVFTEVLNAEINGNKIENLSQFENVAADRFAKQLSSTYDYLAKIHPSFSRVHGLHELLGLTKGIEELEVKPDLAFWLRDFRVKGVRTVREVQVLRRNEIFELPSSGGIQSVSQDLSGGVHLVAIALRLKAGEIDALKEAVLLTRPKMEALSWNFIIAEWLIPSSSGMMHKDDVIPLFSHAMFLQEKRHYDEAIKVYGKILTLNPNLTEAYNNRGNAYLEMNLFDRAIVEYTRALEVAPQNGNALNNRCLAFGEKKFYGNAIADCNKALKINPYNAIYYFNRGLIHSRMSLHGQAIADYSISIDINPEYFNAFFNRGIAYSDKGLLDQAIRDFERAREIDPNNSDLLNRLGIAYHKKGGYDQAIAQFSKAIEIRAGDAMFFNNRGLSYIQKKYFREAIADFNMALKMNPHYSEAYCNRGQTYVLYGYYDMALADFHSALVINSDLKIALFGMGMAYEKLNNIEEAIKAYTLFVSIAPEEYSNFIALASQKIETLKHK